MIVRGAVSMLQVYTTEEGWLPFFLNEEMKNEDKTMLRTKLLLKYFYYETTSNTHFFT